MRVNCEGCGGCCTDWRPIGPPSLNRERHSERPPLDDTYNLVPLLRDEIRDFVDAGYGDALTPRLFLASDEDESVTIDGNELAAVDGRPVFLVGLRKLPKPVGPFGTDPVWLDTCSFLDPTTLQCRLHDSAHYPETCSIYPGHNLLLDKETECERVEDAYGGDRLQEASTDDVEPPRFAPAALGSKLFVHPEPDQLEGCIDRLATGKATLADRAEFVAIAVGTAVGSTEVNHERADVVRERVEATESWVGRAAAEWATRAGEEGSEAPDPETIAPAIEDDNGAPRTPGWE